MPSALTTSDGLVQAAGVKRQVCRRLRRSTAMCRAAPVGIGVSVACNAPQRLHANLQRAALAACKQEAATAHSIGSPANQPSHVCFHADLQQITLSSSCPEARSMQTAHCTHKNARLLPRRPPAGRPRSPRPAPRPGRSGRSCRCRGGKRRAKGAACEARAAQGVHTLQGRQGRGPGVCVGLETTKARWHQQQAASLIN